jgi:hypothetical protein
MGVRVHNRWIEWWAQIKLHLMPGQIQGWQQLPSEQYLIGSKVLPGIEFYGTNIMAYFACVFRNARNVVHVNSTGRYKLGWQRMHHTMCVFTYLQSIHWGTHVCINRLR